MGRLAKARKRAASKKQFNKKQNAPKPQQGGRSISASRRASQITKNNLSTSPLLNDGNLQRVQQIRNSQQSQTSFLNSVVSQEQRRSDIQNIQRQKRANRIRDEFDSIEKARQTINNSNLSDTAKRQLLSNFNRKEQRLNQDLAGLTPGQSAQNRRQENKIRSLQQTIEQQKFSLRQAQGSSGEQRTADPIASSLAVTPGGNAKVRAIAAKLGQNIQELSRLRQTQQQGPQKQKQKTTKNVFDIPKPSEKVDTPLGLSSFAAKQKKKDDPLKDAVEGFAAPFFNLGKLFVNTPEAIRRDVEQFAKTGKTFTLIDPFDPKPKTQKQLTEGEKFFQKEALGKLTPTIVDSVITETPTGRSKTFDLFSGLGEVALFAAPFAAGKGAGPAASIASKIRPKTTKAPVRPQTQAPTIANIAKGVTKQQPKKTSPVSQRRVPRNVFAQDKAEPSFVSTLTSLGRGTTKTPGGEKFPTFTFGKPGGGKGGGTTKPRTFQDPKPSKGDKIVKGKDGLFQIQKTKTVTKPKTATKQKTSSRQFLERQINLGSGKVKQVPVNQKSLLKNPFPKQKVKTKSKAQTKTEEFFKQQSKSAKKRQQDSLFGLLLPRGLQQTQTQKQKQTSDIFAPILRQQQKQKPLLTPRQKKDFAFAPILRTGQKQTFPPFAPTTTTTITPLVPIIPTTIINRPPGHPPRFPGGLTLFPFLPGGGGSGDPSARGGRFGKRFLASSLDPLTPGVIARAGVPDLLQGSTRRVFSTSDKALARARKRQGVGNSVGDILSNPFGPTRRTSKNKSRKGKSRKRKSLLDDPFGGFGF